jgi:hypothetical protein
MDVIPERVQPAMRVIIADSTDLLIDYRKDHGNGGRTRYSH